MKWTFMEIDGRRKIYVCVEHCSVYPKNGTADELVI